MQCSLENKISQEKEIDTPKKTNEQYSKIMSAARYLHVRVRSIHGKGGKLYKSEQTIFFKKKSQI